LQQGNMPDQRESDEAAEKQRGEELHEHGRLSLTAGAPP
jgi:hypothetical protein